MSKPRRDRTSLWIALAICAVGMIVGFGSCGFAILSGVGGRPQWYADYVSKGGAILFFVSLLGFVLSFVIFTGNQPKE